MSIAKQLRAKNLEHNEAGEPNHVYEFGPDVREKWFETSRIEKELVGGGVNEKIRLARFGVHGDGSCAYHTICTALNYDDYVHQTDEKQKQIVYKFRCSLGEKMKQEDIKKILKKAKGAKSSTLTLTEFQEQLCDPKVWADEAALRMVGEILNMNLIFLDMDKNTVYCGMHHPDAITNPRMMPSTIVVCWVSHSHFEPLARILNVGKHVSEIKVLFEPSESKVDAELVKALMSRYKDQCKLRK
jgi:hypothetical protein